MDIYAQAVLKIIQGQQAIIGPIAFDQAKKVPEIKILKGDEITIDGDGKIVLEHLVSQYQKFFGNASVEVCKDAIKEMSPHLTNDQLPEILQ